MKCKGYVFLLSSGQLDEASLPVRLEARAHRLICRYCRAFTRNDEALSRILDQMKERLLEQEPGQENAADR